MNIKKMLAGLSLLALVGVISLTQTSCGTDDPVVSTPTTPTDTNDFEEEYLMIDDTRYTADQFVTKTIVTSNSTSTLRVFLGNATFTFQLQRDMDADTLVAREYTPADYASTDPDFNDFAAGLWYFTGALPNKCQNAPIEDPTPAHGQCEAVKINDKYVSIFKDIQMECKDGFSDEINSVSGYLIWEKK